MAIDTSRLLEIASGSLSEGEQEVEDPTRTFDVSNLIEILSRPAVGGVSRPTEKDLGVGGAFVSGLKTGVIEPFRLLGAQPEEVTLDETGEQVANFLGAMVGLGISFIPFAFGTGIALRGLGLTAKLAGGAITAKEAARSQALFNFVRNTAAGSVQFAGTSESLAEVPGKVAAGAAFGAAIEGVFLARAMRGRRGAVAKAKLLDDGNPIPDTPVDLDRQALEIEISPSVNKTTEQMTVELNSAFTQNKKYEEVVVDLLGEHIETARITGLSKEGADNILGYAKENFPTAQRLSRRTSAGVHEVLIHEPFDPANVLTKQQLAEWKSTGYASGERLIYAGNTVEATGNVVEAGFVQVRVPLQKGKRQGVPFAAPVEEVTRPITTSFFNESAGRNQILQAAVGSTEGRIGFVVPASTVGRGASLSARRGFVDVAEFETAASFKEFAKQFTDDIAGVQAATPEEAVGILAQRAGIPGLRIMDEGVTTRIHVFDQKNVGFVTEPPQLAKSVSEVRPIGDIITSTKQVVIFNPEAALGKGTMQLDVPARMRSTPEIPRSIRIVLHPNTIPGEGPWRISRFVLDEDPKFSSITSSGHTHFADRGKALAAFNAKVKSAPKGAVVETAEGARPPTSIGGVQRVAQPRPSGTRARPEIPNLGLVLDDAVFSTSLTGEPILSSFIPSWRNSISAPLREAGIPEKEIAHYLDLYAINTSKRLDSLMEPEFQAIKNASEIQFGGCP
jgi:hypothetical protein